MGQIYKITNILNGLVYIGQTKYNAINRYNAHMNTYKNTRFYNSIHKYGSKNFILEILEDNVPVDKLDEREIYYIALYDSYHNGYNETIGGNGTIGYHFTGEDRKKKSNSMKKAWKNPNIPLTSKERNEKISKANKGRPKSIEHRNKLSKLAKGRTGDKNAFYGKHHTKETNKKISDANSIAVDMFDKDMTLIKTFSSGREAARYFKEFLSLTIQLESVYRAINWHCISEKIYKKYYFRYHKV